MRELSAILLLLLSIPCHAAEEETRIQGLAWPALSPDGRTLAFEWLNDLWIASAEGGEAKRVVKHPAREAYPKFTPDGKRLVFSSERSGSAQVYSVRLDGSGLKTHTRQTEGNVLEAVFPDGKRALVRGERDSSGYKPERLIEIDLTANTRERILFDATADSVSISPDGRRFLFCRGGEQLYRKGYLGSRASEIWLYDAESATFENMISEKWESRSPLWQPDGKGFYYISSKTGVFNVWSRDAEGDRQLTFFEDDGVVIPVLSEDGETMIFRTGQEVYRFEPGGGGEPQVIRFFTQESAPERSVRKVRVTGTSHVVFSDDGNRIVFSAAGDLWTMAHGAKVPERLTETDELDEGDPALSPDGKRLYYLCDDGLDVDVCSRSWDDGKMGEMKYQSKRPGSKRSLRASPDGKWLSWLEATGNLVTAPAAGGEGHVVMEEWAVPTYDWSPDVGWLVVAAKDRHANRDIFLVPADGSSPPYNLSSHPAFEGSPKWSPDGSTILFSARRDSDGLARIWLAHVDELLTGTKVSDADLKAVAASVEPLATDLREPSRMMWMSDSKTVLYQSRDREHRVIYQVSAESGDLGEYMKLSGIPAGIGPSGATRWKVDRVPVVCRGGKMTSFDFSMSVEQDRDKRLRLGFRRIWRSLKERFYDESMNGRDWQAVLEKYEDAAVQAMDSRQFDRVVAQLMGELNASHLTFKTRPWGVKTRSDEVKNPTAHPGLVFRNTADGPLLIERVVAGSPISQVADAPLAGEQVLCIEGKTVDASTPLEGYFAGAVGHSIPIEIGSAGGEKRSLELVPISYEAARTLDQEEKAAAAVRAAAEGDHRITYLPFRRMKSDDLEKLSVEVYRASLESEGLILDLRDNAGGRVADEVLALFCQPVHTFTVPRGGPRGYPTDRLVSPSWDGPLVVLCNENTYSNAEIFCHAFKQIGRGVLVGVPTNGGVISAVSITIPEAGELQVPFRGWFLKGTGRDLELNGAVPDVVVPFPPDAQAARRDPQLEKAIEVMNREISEQKPEIDGILKTGRKVMAE